MTRVAVIGVGAMGRNHARIYREMPEVELVAVVDADRGQAERVGRLIGARPYESVGEMLLRERPVAASVAVPTHAHFETARELLQAGCHVLVEKPITANLGQARELVTMAQAASRLLMVGHIERFNPAIVELKRRLDAGEIGRVYQIHARRLGPFPARIRDVGVVADLATHDLDVMRYLTGREAIRVYAETRREVHTSNEDLFCGLVRFDDDTLGVLETNWLTPTKVRELYVTGERGMFRADYLTQDLYFFENAETNGSGWAALRMLRGVSEGAMIRYPIERKEPLRAELEAFVAAARGEAMHAANGGDGVAALELALALVDSAESHQVKEVGTESGWGLPTCAGG